MIIEKANNCIKYKPVLVVAMMICKKLVEELHMRNTNTNHDDDKASAVDDDG